MIMTISSIDGQIYGAGYGQQQASQLKNSGAETAQQRASNHGDYRCHGQDQQAVYGGCQGQSLVDHGMKCADAGDAQK